jgi:1,4-dihydroxy-2-naphthoate polyprenyltransferase
VRRAVGCSLLTVALTLQIAVNYANDLFDGVAGIDTAERIGPRRVVAAGLVTPRR